MNRFRRAVFSTPILLTATFVSAATADRPNVLVILTDDQGWGDLSGNGNSNLETPNIDRLAKQGASFDRFFVCPVCSPTRAEFLTGRYFPRTGVKGVSRGAERMDLDEQTIAEVFHEAGYRTGAFGKWHNGTQHPWHPNSRGFEEYYGFCSGHWGNYWSPILDHNGEIVQGNGFIIDDLTDHAIDFIKTSAEEPFFCYVPYNTPHSPMQVPDRWWDRHKSGELKQRHRDPSLEDELHTRAALAMCENIDWNVGRLMETLQKNNLEDNTVVVYFCDNGPNGYRWNGGMKGRKGNTDEGGVRSPCFVRWPGRIEAGRTISQIGGAIDLLPTLSELAGIRRSGRKPLDGKSLKPLLLNEPTEWNDRTIVSRWNKGLSVRNQRFRLDEKGQLFDIGSDPGQKTDVADQYPAVAEQLTQARRHYEQTVLSEYEQRDPEFLIGHSDATTTQLPARDAESTGSIQRSNRHPNSSHFGHWVSTDDEIFWPVSVLTDGIYSAEILYSCRKENAGALIRLESETSTGSTHTEARATPHESELIGAAEDRFDRGEGYEQNWGRMDLGRIQLTAGKAKLRLRTMEIPGNAAIDFRLLLLRRGLNPVRNTPRSQVQGQHP